MNARRKRGGFSLIEAVFGIGILALAVLTILTLCSTVLRYRRVSTNQLNAARTTDMVLERTVASIAANLPEGARDAFWADEYPFPSSAYKTGFEMVGRQRFNYAVHATNIAGLGSSSADPPNLMRRIDVYVWWEGDNEAGSKRTIGTRMINSGDEP